MTRLGLRLQFNHEKNWFMILMQICGRSSTEDSAICKWTIDA